MSKILWKNKFIVVNLILVAGVKIAFVYSGMHLVALIQDIIPFSRNDIITRTNDFRQSIGVEPLKESVTLDIAAAQKLQDMVQNQYFAHFSPDGVSPWHWFEINQYSYSYAGENLAIGFLDADATMEAWIQSPAHRKNLANSHYQEIGVAVESAKIKDIEGILVVQLFGTPSLAVDAGSPLGIGLSQSSAKDTERAPTPTASPNASLRPSPAISSAVPAETGAESSIPPVRVSVSDTTIRALGGMVNRMTMVYTFVVALGAVFYLLTRQIRKEFFVKTVIHVIIFMLAATLPLLAVSSSGFIL